MVQTMMTFLSTYCAWTSNTSPAFPNAWKNSVLKPSKDAMMAAVQGLYTGANAPTNTPCF